MFLPRCLFKELLPLQILPHRFLQMVGTLSQAAVLLLFMVLSSPQNTQFHVLLLSF